MSKYTQLSGVACRHRRPCWRLKNIWYKLRTLGFEETTLAFCKPCAAGTFLSQYKAQDVLTYHKHDLAVMLYTPAQMGYVVYPVQMVCCTPSARNRNPARNRELCIDRFQRAVDCHYPHVFWHDPHARVLAGTECHCVKSESAVYVRRQPYAFEPASGSSGCADCGRSCSECTTDRTLLGLRHVQAHTRGVRAEQHASNAGLVRYQLQKLFLQKSPVKGRKKSRKNKEIKISQKNPKR
jgi:hypothetical protein